MPEKSGPPPLPAHVAIRRFRTPLILLGVAALLLSLILPWMNRSSAGAAIAYGRFFTAPPSSITRIVLTPSNSPYKSPIAAPVVITNPATIDAVLQTLRPPTEVKLNHPGSLSRFEIEITDAAGTSYGTVEQTSNQGMLLYSDSGNYTSDKLGNLLLAATAPAPAASAPAGQAK
jgi:hypothetical protein